MKVIIESGATKGDWRLISEQDGTQHQIVAKGTNVSTMPMASIRDIIHDACCRIKEYEEEVTAVYLYTAGVLTPEITQELHSFFIEEFGEIECDVQTDLTAAARAACGHECGIAAILGTGSNSCQYDGEKIVKQVYSGGFILGDEGGAATLGKLYISDFIKGLVPAEIAEDFKSRFPSDYGSIVTSIYKSAGSPSGYLGSLAPFIMEHYGHPYIKELVDGNFRSFFRRCIKQYDTNTYSIGIVGGFGYALQETIRAIASEEGISVSSFVQTPINGLIEYHK